MYLSFARHLTEDGHKSGQNTYKEYYVYKDISSKPGKFKIALKHYLLTHSFYTLDELFSKQKYLLLPCLFIPYFYIVQLY